MAMFRAMLELSSPQESLRGKKRMFGCFPQGHVFCRKLLHICAEFSVTSTLLTFESPVTKRATDYIKLGVFEVCRKLRFQIIKLTQWYKNLNPNVSCAQATCNSVTCETLNKLWSSFRCWCKSMNL